MITEPNSIIIELVSVIPVLELLSRIVSDWISRGNHWESSGSESLCYLTKVFWDFSLPDLGTPQNNY